ncbi:shikimate dehydrogenase family protein [Desulfosediminicola flagellatus]|uniref:shikimate dehydrogenase family protein n=1 Tax=Desulfosediminicola flagellatus TaxID=2569541 RepID=UPI0010AC871B|nr:shikimate dehydrogenase [Desulfosediminicola flagellatus]
MSKTVKLGLLGNGISRTRAKVLHELLGEMYGLQVTYQVMDLGEHPTPVSISDELKRCSGEGFRGVNVTHPYKQDAFKTVTLLDHFPTGLTSVNTVLFESEKMVADNTDYSGFYDAFVNQFGSNYSPGRVLMLGAGGVGVAIAFALKQLALTELVIYDLEPGVAEKLVSQLCYHDIPAKVAGDDLVAEMLGADGLINATPVGMFQYPGNPFPQEGFRSQNWAFDAVYTPVETAFIRQCEDCGISTLSGFRLFLYQGLNAFERFTGITPDASTVESEFLKRYPLE